MLLSLLALVIACFAFCISRRFDDVTGLLMKLLGLFSVLLSLMYSPWLIKLLLGITIWITPSCPQQFTQSNSQPVRCSYACMFRLQCPYY